MEEGIPAHTDNVRHVWCRHTDRSVGCIFAETLCFPRCLRSLLCLGCVRARLLTPDKLPVWVQHVLGHKVLNQDLATLHHQASLNYYDIYPPTS